MPVLANILFDVQRDAPHGDLTLTATDLSRYVVCRVRSDITEPGTVTLPARLTADVVGALPDGTVNLTTGETDVELTRGDARSKLDAISADEFPYIPEVGESSHSVGIAARSVGLAANELAGAIDQVIIAAARDESRPILTGILCPKRPSQCLVSCRFWGCAYRCSARFFAILTLPSYPAAEGILIPVAYPNKCSRV